MKYYTRFIEKKVDTAAKQFPVTVLTGPRQSGKSTLLRHLYPDYKYYTFDDPVTRQFANEDPGLFMESVSPPAILDEIQYVPQILPYLKIITDKNRHKYGQFILTGSQIFHLMRDLSESLAGRAAILELLPFSIGEMQIKQSLSITNLFGKCFSGFYPDPAVNGVDVNLFYGSYVRTYIERDIRQLRAVHDVAVFQRFMGLLAARNASLLNLSNIAGDCGISHTTAQNWLSLLENSRIVYLLRPYLANLGKRLIKSPKIYFTDTGLVRYLLKYPTPETLFHGPAAGAFFENFLIMEALKYKFNFSDSFEIFFYRDSNGNEIDLIVETGTELFLFEIKLKKSISRRDIRVLSAFPEKDKKISRYVISAYETDLALSREVKNLYWYKFVKDFRHIIYGTEKDERTENGR